jgi:hypothetical protein
MFESFNFFNATISWVSFLFAQKTFPTLPSPSNYVKSGKYQKKSTIRTLNLEGLNLFW